ncbi:MAG: hypothetical protein WKF37_03655 [Bryobacteraceae bacterium]
MATLDRKPAVLLFGLGEDLTGEILNSLQCLCSAVRSTQTSETILESEAEVIFCQADLKLVSRLRDSYPKVPIIVTSRKAEVGDWLDSIEAVPQTTALLPLKRLRLSGFLNPRCAVSVRPPHSRTVTYSA